MVLRNTVDSKSLAYQEMEDLWQLPDALLGGTLRMRREASRWLLPKEAEDSRDYISRVSMSYLFGGYERTLDELSSRPFEKPVSLQTQAKLPEFLAEIEEDVDRTRKNLTAFAKELFHEALHRGVTHVLVDFPRVRPGATLEDRRRLKARPILIHVQAPRLPGWRTEKLEDGSEVLSMVRIYEQETVPDGDYGDKIVERVRVFTRSTWEIHEREAVDADGLAAEAGTDGAGPDPNPGPDDADDLARDGYVLTDQGTHKFGEVPLLTLYFKRTGYMTGRPVFENVAQLNLAHFQSDSRQRSYLDFARIGAVALLGFTEEEVASGGFAWGVNRFLRTERGPQEADVKTVEHSGHAIEAGRNDLRDLEEQMQVLGTAPLVQRATAITATGEARDEDRGMSKAESWIRDLESFLEECYAYAARWLGVELPEDFAVDIFSDFGVTLRGAEESRLLLDLCLAGKLSSETLLREFKRRGVFADSFAADEELERIEEEGPALPPMGAFPPQEQQDEEGVTPDADPESSDPGEGEGEG